MTKQIEILNQQVNGNPQETNEQLFKTKRLTGTPFNILNRDEKYCLTLGNNLLTQEFSTEKELLEHLENEKWNIMVSLILILDEFKAKQPIK